MVGFGIASCVVILIAIMNALKKEEIKCKFCGKQIKEFKVKSYDYHNEYYCPHCNREYRMY